MVMLPLTVFTLAVPPVSAPSAVCNSAIVDTSPPPVPNVTVSVGFAPTLMSIV